MIQHSDTVSESVRTHGEGLLRFPGSALTHHQLWLPSGLAPNFDEPALFDRLIRSHAYRNQTLSHSYKGTHGPFAIDKIRPDHYESVSAEAVRQALHTRLIPDSAEGLTRYRDPWPGVEALHRRLLALLAYTDAKRLQWYRLAIDLDDGQYWSDEHRKAPILDRFEEWVGVDPEAAMVHMLQVIRD
jgi:hypothetical protein